MFSTECVLLQCITEHAVNHLVFAHPLVAYKQQVTLAANNVLDGNRRCMYCRDCRDYKDW